MRNTSLLLLPVFCAFAIACSSDNTSSTPSQPVASQNVQAANGEAPLAVQTPNIYEFTSGPQGKLSIHIYSEDGIWIVEQNKIDVDGLPTPQGRWTFTTKEKAYAYAQENLGISESQRNDQALDQEPSEELLFSENLNSGAELWKVTNTWNWGWEIEFAKWMRANLHPDFFQALGIENDCADAYYQARMIFAYENALPVSFRLAGGGAYFTQKTVRPEWKKLKTDADWRKNKQFLKALDYIANTTYTHTLGKDTYPVEMSKEGLIEGTAFLSLGETSGHTLLVNEINLGDATSTRLPMYTLNSTVPKTVRPLYESMFYQSSQPQKSPYGNVGFVRFRWPKSSGASALVDAKKMPYYSEEQYDPDFVQPVSDENPEYKDFSITVFRKLNPDFNPSLRITEGLAEIDQMVAARKDVIIEGYAVCKAGCKEGSADYENWSTPSRDKRIKELLHDLEMYQSALYAIPDVSKSWEDALTKNIVELDGENYVLSHLKWTFQNSFFSSDPNQTPEIRWGLSATAFAQSAFMQLNPLLQARKTKVSQKTDCLTSPTCTVFSTQYMENGTFIEDQDIQNAISTRNQYCSIVGEAKCAAFNAALAAMPTQIPGHSSFMETWNNIYTLNSDPRVGEAQRWGAPPVYLKSVTVPGSLSALGRYKTKLAASKYIYDSSKNETTYEVLVIDSVTQQIDSLGVMPEFTAYAFSDKVGQLLIANAKSKELSVVAMDTMAKTSVDVSGLSFQGDPALSPYSSVTWVSESRFVWSYFNRLALFADDGAGSYKWVRELDGYTTAGYNSSLGYKTVNRAASEADPSDFVVSFVDLLDDSKPEVSFEVNSVLGPIHPNYVSFEGVSSDKTALVSWSKYSDSGSKTGHIVVSRDTGVAKTTTAFNNLYFNSYSDGVATVSGYDEAAAKSFVTFYFLNDDLTVKSKEKFEGYCNNCYGQEKLLLIGDAVYTLDSNKKSVTKVAQVVGAKSSEIVSINSIYGKFASLSVSENESYYTVLSDMENSSSVLAARSMYFDKQPGTYPTVSLSSSVTVEKPEGPAYYGVNLVLSLDHLEKGPIATPQYISGGEGEGEHEGYEGEVQEEMLTAPDLKDIKMAVKVLDPVAIQPMDESISLVFVNDKTLIIFK